MEKYKFLEHTADVKFQAYGKTLEEAFANAVLALTDVIVEQKEVEPAEEKIIEIESESKEALLYDFLEKFLYLIDTEHFVVAEVKSISIDNLKLKAVVMGDKGLEKYSFKTHIKAMTYNDMVIDEKPGNVTLQVVLDL